MADSEVGDGHEYYAHPPCVILHLTDRCNLSCSFCAKGVPFQNDEGKRDISLAEIEQISERIKDHAYDILKVSGGEPTLHREFATITRRLPELFPGKRYYLATNGTGLSKYRDVLSIYDRIDLSYYPEQQAQAKYYSKARDLVALNSNIVELSKGLNADEEAGGTGGFAESTRDGFAFVDDIRLTPNLGRTRIFERCGFKDWRVIVKGRIYPCCISAGLVEVRGISPLEVSVPLDADWRESLLKVQESMNEGACQQCWVDCEKWRVPPPTSDLFDISGLRLASPSAVADIVFGTGVGLGTGWQDLEQFGGETFRWVENDAEILCGAGSEPIGLRILVEKDPGLGARDFTLRAINSRGEEVGAGTVGGRSEVRFQLQAGKDRSLRLHIEGGGEIIDTDPRILNFRVFRIDATTHALASTP